MRSEAQALRNRDDLRVVVDAPCAGYRLVALANQAGRSDSVVFSPDMAAAVSYSAVDRLVVAKGRGGLT